MAPRLTAAEVRSAYDKISNWGRWGKEDERGALNFITPAKRAAAARLAQNGEIVSLALPLSTATAPDNPQPVQHLMLHAGPPGYA
ncbi:MAG: cyclase family protein, partial [Candidatus Binataceae bacterium]